eukprot:COSAG05_NODE_793_length_7295_cov_2.666481_7_plen_88_part_00
MSPYLKQNLYEVITTVTMCTAVYSISNRDSFLRVRLKIIRDARIKIEGNVSHACYKLLIIFKRTRTELRCGKVDLTVLVLDATAATA